MQLMCYSGCLIALIGLSALPLPRDGLAAAAAASSAPKLKQSIKKETDYDNTIFTYSPVLT